ncbi:four helix bundle protein [Candidatus Woesebacteria bacterium]|nr:four helix bundle protein [Candidatus Woesebacteria bacterium]
MSDSESATPQVYRSYHELRVWQKSIELNQLIIKTLEDLPTVTRNLLGEHLVRACASIPAHIANGYASRSKTDYIDNLKSSLRQLSVVESIVLTQGTEGEFYQSVAELLTELRKMLAGLTSSLTKPKKESPKVDIEAATETVK